MATRLFSAVAKGSLSTIVKNNNAIHPCNTALAARLILPSFNGSNSRLKSDSSGNNDDLVVEYLDGDSSGVVVFGLNRPKVLKHLYFPHQRKFKLFSGEKFVQQKPGENDIRSHGRR